MNKREGGLYDMTETVIKNLTEYGNTYCTSKKEKKNTIGLIKKFQVILAFYRLKIVAKKLDFSDVIEKRKGFCGGKAVLKGTRITVEAVYNVLLKKLKENDNFDYCIEELKKEYPTLIEDKQIFMSLIYYIRHASIRIV